MSTYVMSDIHGCSAQYHRMLKKIGFSDSDQLYIIGDVVDRGRDGIELLMEIKQQKNIVMMMGNHEMMMLNAITNDERDIWRHNGCEPTLAGLAKLSEAEQTELIRWLVLRPVCLNVTVGEKEFLLVHACPPDICGMVDEYMVWDRVDVNAIDCTNRTVIIGHTPTMFYTDGVCTGILHGENGALNIDCGCVYGGQLACVRLDDLKEYYI